MDDSEKGKVVSINQAKKSGSGKVSKAKVRQAIYDAISGKPSFAEQFPARFVVVRQTLGSRILHLLGGENEIKIPSNDDALHFLITYCHKMAKFDDRYLIDDKEASTILSTWTKTQPTIEPPPVIAFKDYKGLTYRRIPFIPTAGLTPTWESLLNRVSNQRAFMAFIGSLFVNESHGQQYFWLRGEGGDGKGAIGRWLERIFQKSYFTISDIKPNNFWLASLMGKRVCVFSDWENMRFVTSGQFKSMSGGDPQAIEAKFKETITVKLPTKYIFFSNNRPEISSAVSDMRRIIYSQIKPIPDEMKEHNAFEDKLWNESSAFIFECLKVYREDCPDHGPIPFFDDEAKEMAEENENYWQGLFDRYFDVGGRTSSETMSVWMKKNLNNSRDRHDWYKFIRRKYNATSKLFKVNKRVFRGWEGIQISEHEPAREAQDLLDKR